MQINRTGYFLLGFFFIGGLVFTVLEFTVFPFPIFLGPIWVVCTLRGASLCSHMRFKPAFICFGGCYAAEARAVKRFRIPRGGGAVEGEFLRIAIPSIRLFAVVDRI